MQAPPAAQSVPKAPFHRTLYFRVLVAIALGILVGVVAPDHAKALKPLGDAFIALVKMTIAPLIFCTIVPGIGNMKSMRAVGRSGGLALVYFLVASIVALLVGLLVVNLVKPGSGLHLVPTPHDLEELKKYTDKPALTITRFILDIIPDTFVGAFTKGDLLPVLLVAVLFGFAVQSIGERGEPVLDLVERVGQVVFAIIGMLMKLAPIGAFGAMAYTIGAYGLGTLKSLGLLMACFYGTCLLFVFGVLGLVARIHGFSIVRFVRFIREELFIVLGTSSSESVLPRLMAKLELLGASKSTVGLVVPAGYSFNLDGTAIYLTMAAVFVAQVTGTPLSIGAQVELLAILLLSSKGAAGVTGSGFIVLAATLQSLGTVPVTGLAIILGIDRFMSEARALTNTIGNGVATLVVAKWTGDLDTRRLDEMLRSRPPG